MGIDPEPWSRWAYLEKKHDNLHFIRGSYDNIPPALVPGYADIVICNQVYEHVPDPVALVQFVQQILKPGGYCYFAGPNLFFPIEPHVFWPFVHWLPRAFAVKLMRECGAQHVVEANSASYWTLRQWLQGFEIINAVPAILRHPQDYGRKGLLWRAISYAPLTVLNALTPLSPGFVFLLHKPRTPLPAQ